MAGYPQQTNPKSDSKPEPGDENFAPSLEDQFLKDRVVLLADECGVLRKRVDTLEEAVYLLLSRVPPIETNCMRYRKLLQEKVGKGET